MHDPYRQGKPYTPRLTCHGMRLAWQARLFHTVEELNTHESHKEEELLPELLKHEKSLVAFENVIVVWDPGFGFIAWIRLIRLAKHVAMKVQLTCFMHLLVLREVRS